MRFLFLILVLLSITACDREKQAIAPVNSSNQESPQASPVLQNTSPVAQTNVTAPSQILRTETFSPQPIRITVANLPQPYATQSASKSPQVVPPSHGGTLRVPAGFTVNIFANNLDAPRWLALTPTGDVLVTETRQNRIRLLRDTNGDGVADVRETFATRANGLNIPFGMAFSDRYFFLGNSAEVRRFPYNQGQQQLTGTGEKIADLPGGGYNQHWTRNVVTSPDKNQLYVSIGSASNASVEELPRASVQVMNLDGQNQKTFAYGLC